MKKALLIVIVLLIAAAVIYFQQDKDTTEVEAPSTAAESAVSATSAAAGLPVSPAHPDARVYFVSPNDGDVVSSPVQVEFGLENMQVSPAGIDLPFAGHHHILINMDELPDLSQPLPATDSLVHFGGGQTGTTLDLPPGEHTLQLVLGNHLHIPHAEPVVSEKITITVQ